MTLSRQDMFDKALTGIRGQKYERSWDANVYGCVYTGPNDIHCAVGHCLTKEQQEKVIEYGYNTYSSSDLFIHSMEISKYLGCTDNYEFIGELQEIHDTKLDKSRNEDVVSKFEEGMKALAEDWNLNYTAP